MAWITICSPLSKKQKRFSNEPGSKPASNHDGVISARGFPLAPMAPEPRTQADSVLKCAAWPSHCEVITRAIASERDKCSRSPTHQSAISRGERTETTCSVGPPTGRPVAAASFL